MYPPSNRALPSTDGLPDRITLWFTSYSMKFMQILAMEDGLTRDEVYYILHQGLSHLTINVATGNIEYSEDFPSVTMTSSINAVRNLLAREIAAIFLDKNPTLSYVILTLIGFDRYHITYDVTDAQ